MKAMLTLCALTLAAHAQSTSAISQIPSGVVAAHMIGRMVLGADGAAELIGYYPFLEGIDGAIFSSDSSPSERTAHFTFRSSRFNVSVLRNDPLTHLRATPIGGTSAIVLRVYYNPNPNQEFTRPDSFSAGELIGEFQARGGLTTVVPFTATINTGSFRKTASTDFTFREKTYNLGQLAENITVELKGAPLDIALGFIGASIPFGGSAIAAAATPVATPQPAYQSASGAKTNR
jgi:hypothetical protein